MCRLTPPSPVSTTIPDFHRGFEPFPSAERYKTVDVTDPVAVVVFCLAAQQSYTAA
jgi:hypothetical protein